MRERDTKTIPSAKLNMPSKITAITQATHTAHIMHAAQFRESMHQSEQGKQTHFNTTFQLEAQKLPKLPDGESCISLWRIRNWTNYGKLTTIFEHVVDPDACRKLSNVDIEFVFNHLASSKTELVAYALEIIGYVAQHGIDLKHPQLGQVVTLFLNRPEFEIKINALIILCHMTLNDRSYVLTLIKSEELIEKLQHCLKEIAEKEKCASQTLAPIKMLALAAMAKINKKMSESELKFLATMFSGLQEVERSNKDSPFYTSPRSSNVTSSIRSIWRGVETELETLKSYTEKQHDLCNEDIEYAIRRGDARPERQIKWLALRIIKNVLLNGQRNITTENLAILKNLLTTCLSGHDNKLRYEALMAAGLLINSGMLKLTDVQDCFKKTASDLKVYAIKAMAAHLEGEGSLAQNTKEEWNRLLLKLIQGNEDDGIRRQAKYLQSRLMKELDRLEVMLDDPYSCNEALLIFYKAASQGLKIRSSAHDKLIKIIESEDKFSLDNRVNAAAILLEETRHGKSLPEHTFNVLHKPNSNETIQLFIISALGHFAEKATPEQLNRIITVPLLETLLGALTGKDVKCRSVAICVVNECLSKTEMNAGLKLTYTKIIHAVEAIYNVEVVDEDAKQNDDRINILILLKQAVKKDISLSDSLYLLLERIIKDSHADHAKFKQYALNVIDSLIKHNQKANRVTTLSNSMLLAILELCSNDKDDELADNALSIMHIVMVQQAKTIDDIFICKLFDSLKHPIRNEATAVIIDELLKNGRQLDQYTVFQLSLCLMGYGSQEWEACATNITYLLQQCASQGKFNQATVDQLQKFILKNDDNYSQAVRNSCQALKEAIEINETLSLKSTLCEHLAQYISTNEVDYNAKLNMATLFCHHSKSGNKLPLHCLSVLENLLDLPDKKMRENVLTALKYQFKYYREKMPHLHKEDKDDLCELLHKIVRKIEALITEPSCVDEVLKIINEVSLYGYEVLSSDTKNHNQFDFLVYVADLLEASENTSTLKAASAIMCREERTALKPKVIQARELERMNELLHSREDNKVKEACVIFQKYVDDQRYLTHSILRMLENMILNNHALSETILNILYKAILNGQSLSVAFCKSLSAKIQAMIPIENAPQDIPASINLMGEIVALSFDKQHISDDGYFSLVSDLIVKHGYVSEYTIRGLKLGIENHWPFSIEVFDQIAVRYQTLSHSLQTKILEIIASPLANFKTKLSEEALPESTQALCQLAELYTGLRIDAEWQLFYQSLTMLKSKLEFATDLLVNKIVERLKTYENTKDRKAIVILNVLESIHAVKPLSEDNLNAIGRLSLSDLYYPTCHSILANVSAKNSLPEKTLGYLFEGMCACEKSISYTKRFALLRDIPTQQLSQSQRDILNAEKAAQAIQQGQENKQHYASLIKHLSTHQNCSHMMLDVINKLIAKQHPLTVDLLYHCHRASKISIHNKKLSLVNLLGVSTNSIDMIIDAIAQEVNLEKIAYLLSEIVENMELMVVENKISHVVALITHRNLKQKSWRQYFSAQLSGFLRPHRNKEEWLLKVQQLLVKITERCYIACPQNEEEGKIIKTVLLEVIQKNNCTKPKLSSLMGLITSYFGQDQASEEESEFIILLEAYINHHALQGNDVELLIKELKNATIDTIEILRYINGRHIELKKLPSLIHLAKLAEENAITLFRLPGDYYENWLNLFLRKFKQPESKTKDVINKIMLMLEKVKLSPGQIQKLFSHLHSDNSLTDIVELLELSAAYPSMLNNFLTSLGALPKSTQILLSDYIAYDKMAILQNKCQLFVSANKTFMGDEESLFPKEKQAETLTKAMLELLDCGWRLPTILRMLDQLINLAKKEDSEVTIKECMKLLLQLKTFNVTESQFMKVEKGLFLPEHANDPVEKTFNCRLNKQHQAFLNQKFITKLSVNERQNDRNVKELLEVLAKSNPTLKKSQLDDYEAQISKINDEYHHFKYSFPCGQINKVTIFEDRKIEKWTESDITYYLGNKNTNQNRTLTIAVIMRALELFFPNQSLRDAQKLAILLMMGKSDKQVGKSDKQGRLASIATGEGKSLIVAVIAILTALNGKKVDIITSAPDLAERDVDTYKKLYKLFGLTVASNEDHHYVEGTKDCYKSHIVYGTASQFQADQLRDSYYGLKTRAGRTFDFAIVDEVDSMLLDEGDKITMLSKSMPGMDELNPLFILMSVELEKIITSKNQQAILWNNTFVETSYDLLINHFYKIIEDSEKNTNPLIHIPDHLLDFVKLHLSKWVKNTISARIQFGAGAHYVVQTDTRTNQACIKPVDFQSTGVTQDNTRWGDGLHQQLQIKHGLMVSPMTLVTNYCSNLAYLKKYKHELIGVTGTLGSEKNKSSLARQYDVDFVDVPKFKASQLIKYEPTLLKTEEQVINHSILRAVSEAESGRPVLILCETQNEATIIKERLEKVYSGPIKSYIESNSEQKHFVREQVREKTIIVATNLGGRGLDIKFDKKTESNGGLHVCFTFLPDSLRAEQQGAGRAGRKGERGSYEMILSQEKTSKKFTDGEDLTFEEIIKKRDEMENEHINNFEKNQLPLINAKDDLFENFRDFYQKVDTIPKVANNSTAKPIIKNAIEERWGKWLAEHQFNSDSEYVEAAVLVKMKTDFAKFEKQIREDIENDNVIKNPAYYILLGNEYLNQAESLSSYRHLFTNYYHLAHQAFDKAIKLSPNCAVLAYYYKAFALIIERPDNYKELAQQALSVAFSHLNKHWITQHAAVSLAVKKMVERNRDSNQCKQLTEQLLKQSQMYEVLKNSIQQNILEIEKSQKRVDVVIKQKNSKKQYHYIEPQEALEKVEKYAKDQEATASLSFNHLNAHRDLTVDYQVDGIFKALPLDAHLSISFDKKNMVSCDVATFKKMLSVNQKKPPINKAEETSEDNAPSVVNEIREQKSAAKKPLGVQEYWEEAGVRAKNRAVSVAKYAKGKASKVAIPIRYVMKKMQADFSALDVLPVSLVYEAMHTKELDILLNKIEAIIQDSSEIEVSLQGLTSQVANQLGKSKGTVTLRLPKNELKKYAEVIARIEKEREKMVSAAGPLNLAAPKSLFKIELNNLSQADANKILDIQKIPTSLVYNKLNKEEAKKIITMTESKHGEAVLHAHNIFIEDAIAAINAASKQTQHVKVNREMLSTSLQDLHLPAQTMGECAANGYTFMFNSNQARPKPWKTIALLLSIAVAEIAAGIAITLFTGPIGLNAALFSICEGANDAITSFQLWRTGEVNYLSLFAQKAARMGIGALGVGVALSHAKVATKVGEVANVIKTRLANVKEVATSFIQVNVNKGLIQASNVGLNKVSSMASQSIEENMNKMVDQHVSKQFNRADWSAIINRAILIDQVMENNHHLNLIKQQSREIINSLGSNKCVKHLHMIEAFEKKFTVALNNIDTQLPNFPSILSEFLKRRNADPALAQKICDELTEQHILIDNQKIILPGIDLPTLETMNKCIRKILVEKLACFKNLYQDENLKTVFDYTLECMRSYVVAQQEDHYFKRRDLKRSSITGISKYYVSTVSYLSKASLQVLQMLLNQIECATLCEFEHLIAACTNTPHVANDNDTGTQAENNLETNDIIMDEENMSSEEIISIYKEFKLAKSFHGDASTTHASLQNASHAPSSSHVSHEVHSLRAEHPLPTHDTTVQHEIHPNHSNKVDSPIEPNNPPPITHDAADICSDSYFPNVNKHYRRMVGMMHAIRRLKVEDGHSKVDLITKAIPLYHKQQHHLFEHSEAVSKMSHYSMEYKMVTLEAVVSVLILGVSLEVQNIVRSYYQQQFARLQMLADEVHENIQECFNKIISESARILRYLIRFLLRHTKPNLSKEESRQVLDAIYDDIMNNPVNGFELVCQHLGHHYDANGQGNQPDDLWSFLNETYKSHQQLVQERSNMPSNQEQGQNEANSGQLINLVDDKDKSAILKVDFDFFKFNQNIMQSLNQNGNGSDMGALLATSIGGFLNSQAIQAQSIALKRSFAYNLAHSGLISKREIEKNFTTLRGRRGELFAGISKRNGDHLAKLIDAVTQGKMAVADYLTVSNSLKEFHSMDLNAFCLSFQMEEKEAKEIANTNARLVDGLFTIFNKAMEDEPSITSMVRGIFAKEVPAPTTSSSVKIEELPNDEASSPTATNKVEAEPSTKTANKIEAAPSIPKKKIEAAPSAPAPTPLKLVSSPTSPGLFAHPSQPTAELELEDYPIDEIIKKYEDDLAAMKVDHNNVTTPQKRQINTIEALKVIKKKLEEPMPDLEEKERKLLKSAYEKVMKPQANRAACQ